MVLIILLVIGILFLANEVEKEQEISKLHKNNILRLKDITKEHRWLIEKLLKHLGLKVKKGEAELIKEE